MKNKLNCFNVSTIEIKRSDDMRKEEIKLVYLYHNVTRYKQMKAFPNTKSVMDIGVV